MTVENISWSISTKECCRPRWGLNPRPTGLQSDGASNWATEGYLKEQNFSMKNLSNKRGNQVNIFVVHENVLQIWILIWSTLASHSWWAPLQHNFIKKYGKISIPTIYVFAEKLEKYQSFWLKKGVLSRAMGKTNIVDPDQTALQHQCSGLYIQIFMVTGSCTSWDFASSSGTQLFKAFVANKTI